MKVFGIYLMGIGKDKSAVTITKCTDLSTFGYFQRSTVQEFMSFFASTIAARVSSSSGGSRQSIQQDEYFIHVHSLRSDLCGLVITDREYPARVAFALLSKVFKQFIDEFPPSTWPSSSSSSSTMLDIPWLNDLLVKYQNPEQADDLLKIQRDLDDTKIIIHETIDSVLERGERLEDLVRQSDDLSAASKTFYQNTPKDSCCSLM